MLKKILAIFAMLYAAACFAAVDVNKATAAELDAVKGIGPAISSKILDERKKGDFKDWNDLITRVKGVGEVNAAKFSTEGLTVGGSGYKGAAPAAAKKDATAPKAEEKKAPAAAEAPAASASAPKDAKAEAKLKAADAKAEKAAAKQAKADEKAKKAAEKAKPAADAKAAAPVAPASAVKK
jgi:competence protein ComEA